MAFIYTACASLRLARFNVSSGRYQGRFDGLPTPAAAGMVVSSVWFKNFLVGPEVGLGLPPLLPALGVMSLGLLMVSPIPYHSFKNVRLGRTHSATVIPVVISILLVLQPGLNFFLVGLAYVVSGPLGSIYRWRTGRELLRVEPDGVRIGVEEAPTAPAETSSDSPGPNVTPLAGRRGGVEARENEGAG
jgi:CDP-diacylglycerol--serine O-phosphatidyltransferase